MLLGFHAREDGSPPCQVVPSQTRLGGLRCLAHLQEWSLQELWHSSFQESRCDTWFQILNIRHPGQHKEHNDECVAIKLEQIWKKSLWIVYKDLFLQISCYKVIKIFPFFTLTIAWFHDGFTWWVTTQNHSCAIN